MITNIKQNLNPSPYTFSLFTDKIPEILRLFGKHRVFYEIYSPRGRCILASKSAYETYYICEKIPAFLMENKNLQITQKKFHDHIDQTHFYDHRNLLFQENPEILKIVSYSFDSWKLGQLKKELLTVFPELPVSSKSIWHLEIIFHAK